MSSFAWTVIKGVRVLPIESDPRVCVRGSLHCHFFAHGDLCDGVEKVAKEYLANISAIARCSSLKARCPPIWPSDSWRAHE